MIDNIFTWIVGLPLLTALGWFGRGLFGPTVNEWGLRIKELLTKKSSSKEYVVFSAYEELEKRVKEIHLDGHHRFNDSKPYLHDKVLKKQILKHSKKMRRMVVKTWIEHTHVGSYAESDVFFAGMELLLPYLSEKDLQTIFSKYHDSTQAILWPFLEIVEVQRSELLSSQMVKYLRIKQEEWNNK